MFFNKRSKLKRKLKRLRGKINWETERERCDLLGEFNTIIVKWVGRLPNLRKIFSPAEIEYILSDSVNCVRADKSYYQAKRIIDFVIDSNYEDEPEVDEDGEPVLRRTTPMHHAARHKWNMELVHKLFKIYNNFDVNYTNEFGYTHFHVACEFGLYDVVEKFLELGQDPNCLVEKTGDTPLHVAMEWKREEVSELLLRYGANPNLVNKNKLTPLQVVCTGNRNDYDLIKMLLEFSRFESGQVNVQDISGGTPLLWAVSHGRKSLVKLLLAKGANPNLANSDGSTALHVICQNNHDDVDLLKMIIGRNEYINKLIQIDAQDKWGRTPLHLALIWKHREKTELLLRKGANPNLANAKGSTPLHIICQRANSRNNGNNEDLELFFKINDERNQLVHIDAQDKQGNRPLHLALCYDNKKEAEILLNRGADPNLTNKAGLTPLHIICQRYHDDDCAEMLLRISAEKRQPVQVDTRDPLGQTPLQLAVANLMPNVIDVLCDNGADISSFVFPTQCFLTMRRNPWLLKLGLASLVLIVVERLENRGYEMKRSDALTIMEFFKKFDLLEEPRNLDVSWYEDEQFIRETKRIEVIPDLSLYELINLPPNVSKRRLTHIDYLNFWKSARLWQLSKKYYPACHTHLCEKVSRGFFRVWAVFTMMELTDYYLPQDCCEVIVDKSLSNEDLWKICLTMKGQS